MDFEECTLIKGKDLKDTGMKFYKVLREDMKHNNMQYVEGENVDILPFRPIGFCNPGGLYFTDIENVCEFLDYGNHVREVTFSDDEDIHVEDRKFKAHSITLGPAMTFDDVETWKTLIKNGVDIHTCDDGALIYAAENDYLNVVKYLVSQGATIKADENKSLRFAAESGYLDIVKYLVSKGSDIHACNDYALRWAANNGSLDVVKFLVSKGANININNDEALQWATENEHLKTIKYLIQNGANIGVIENFYISDEKIYNYLKNKKAKVNKNF